MVLGPGGCQARGIEDGHDRIQRRWVVERTLSRLMRSRRLARDYERRLETGETFILWSVTMVMSRRLARHYPRAARTGRGDLSSPRLRASGPRERWTWHILADPDGSEFCVRPTGRHPAGSPLQPE